RSTTRRCKPLLRPARRQAILPHYSPQPIIRRWPNSRARWERLREQMCRLLPILWFPWAKRTNPLLRPARRRGILPRRSPQPIIRRWPNFRACCDRLREQMCRLLPILWFPWAKRTNPLLRPARRRGILPRRSPQPIIRRWPNFRACCDRLREQMCRLLPILWFPWAKRTNPLLRPARRRGILPRRSPQPIIRRWPNSRARWERLREQMCRLLPILWFPWAKRTNPLLRPARRRGILPRRSPQPIIRRWPNSRARWERLREQMCRLLPILWFPWAKRTNPLLRPARRRGILPRRSPQPIIRRWPNSRARWERLREQMCRLLPILWFPWAKRTNPLLRPARRRGILPRRSPQPIIRRWPNFRACCDRLREQMCRLLPILWFPLAKRTNPLLRPTRRRGILPRRSPQPIIRRWPNFRACWERLREQMCRLLPTPRYPRAKWDKPRQRSPQWHAILPYASPELID